ncbi:MAG: TRAP transporter fused permease subunit [Candidatus Rokubacteria bacterium]|nr:TRAP transporter fused permease subunit [Candidatus Rokubacteria bacterium]
MADVEAARLPEEIKTDEAVTRTLAGGVRVGVSFVAVAFALFHIWTSAPFVGAYPDLIQRAIHLLFAFVLCFLLYPCRPGRSPARRPSLFDWVFAALAFVGFVYVIVHYNWIMENPSDSTRAGVLLGTLVTLLTLEAARRTIGLTFTVLAALGMAYALLGAWIPGTWGHRGFSWTSIQELLYLSTQGILGTVTGISATLVAIFLVFGAILYYTGGGETFVDLAKLIAGRSYGGPAKVSVFSSAFFGTISGSAVANVVVDGIFNIPLMKRLKYKSEFAAAVEATASSGGQLMPPVMGAGAFIMAELLQIAYVQVAIAAALPAVLYYLGCGAAIHFEARRQNLETIPAALLPRAREVFAWRRAAALFLPVILLTYFLLRGYTAGTSTFWSIVASVVIFLASATSWADVRARCLGMVQALEAGGKGIVLVATLIAAAGILIGMINLTGIGVKLSEFIIGASGQSLLAALFFAMVVCIILGMGLPTTAAYVLAASVVAPALIKLGAIPLAAHLFVFYFAIISAITPPVCAAVYVAAAIARANWVRTGLIATRLGLAGFIVPYMFVYAPALLWRGLWLEIAWASVTACVGVIALAAGSMGFFARPANWLERLALIGAALLLIKPGVYTDMVGLVVLAAVWASQRLRPFPEVQPAG